MISSPGRKSRPAVRENVKFNEVMFGPKVISRGSQPRKRAAFASALLEDLLDAEAGRIAGAEIGAGVAQRGRDRGADLVGDL